MELPGEPKEETEKIDINAAFIASPTLSASNSIKWVPTWEANLIFEGKNNVGNLYQGNDKFLSDTFMFHLIHYIKVQLIPPLIEKGYSNIKLHISYIVSLISSRSFLMNFIIWSVPSTIQVAKIFSLLLRKQFLSLKKAEQRGMFQVVYFIQDQLVTSFDI